MEILAWSYRRIALLDVPVMLDWYNNRELHETANAKTFHPYTIKELTKYWQKKINRTDASYYAIIINERMIGRVSLKGMDSTGEGIEYAIVIGDPSLYSRGLGTEITICMLEKAFSDPRVRYVQLDVRLDNKRAIRCYEKTGFRNIDSFLENGVSMRRMRVTK
ncbi:GNAT family N-acetyltransferase [Paenibacillus alginolyticus]|uniref:GNAT family N-acetyltransferase n=1 Tax=Paenibacillus alginolyticus TaxID=59839 RepID=UPI00040C5ACA|nr:GNAT family N-acetyltransferase [Paenibacillus alginolyticus]MCY9667189.1 GNAT family N-acetyltransferase [Paenibacillus alginolyticus]